MKKKYEANSIVAITVKTGSFYRRVSFMPLSNGKSCYETESKSLQDAIENHGFFKSGVINLADEPAPAKNAEAVMDAPEVTDAPDDGQTEAELKKIVVAGQSDAVDYLTEKFGISRSKLRSQKAIADAGKEHGVEFMYS